MLFVANFVANSRFDSSSGDSSSPKSKALDSDILNYIRKELSKGYSLEQIRDALLSVGHDINKINYHFSKLKNEVPIYMGKKAYLKDELVKYIIWQVEKGHSFRKIEKALLNAGHHPELIKLHIEHIKHLSSKKKIAYFKEGLFFILIIAVSLLLFFYISSFFTGLDAPIRNKALFGNDSYKDNSLSDSSYLKNTVGISGTEKCSSISSCQARAEESKSAGLPENNSLSPAEIEEQLLIKIISQPNLTNQSNCSILSSMRDYCYFFFASKGRGSCDPITNLSLKDRCFVNLANTNLNPVYCHFISKENLMGSCFADVAVKTKNASLCSVIADGAFRERCVKVVLSKKNANITMNISI